MQRPASPHIVEDPSPYGAERSQDGPMPQTEVYGMHFSRCPPSICQYRHDRYQDFLPCQQVQVCCCKVLHRNDLRTLSATRDLTPLQVGPPVDKGVQVPDSAVNCEFQGFQHEFRGAER